MKKKLMFLKNMKAIISKVLIFKYHLFGTFLTQVKLSKKIINSYHGEDPE